MTPPRIEHKSPSKPLRARLVLASASPRRREILTEAGLEFDVIPSNAPEEERPGEAAEAFADRLAREKALAVARSLTQPEPALVMGADTVVVMGERLLGKPEDPEHAIALLTSLMGRSHRVITGVAIATHPGGELISCTVTSEVTMRSATELELQDYIATGEPMDKAGAYAIQGEGGRRFVERLSGSRSNVIGLPLEETLALLDEASALLGVDAPSLEDRERS